MGKPGNLLDDDQRTLKEDDTVSRKLRIVDIITEKLASYPSEIKRLSSMSVKKASTLCYQLKQDDIIESLSIGDSRVLDRRKDMWERNIKGKDSFKEISWYGLKEYIDGRRVLLVDKQGNTRDVYGNILDEEFNDRKGLRHTIKKALS